MWFKEEALIVASIKNLQRGFFCEAGKRVRHQAEEKCLQQGFLDAQSSLFQAK